jgi:hypothetical protein
VSKDSNHVYLFIYIFIYSFSHMGRLEYVLHIFLSDSLIIIWTSIYVKIYHFDVLFIIQFDASRWPIFCLNFLIFKN